jgi:hypothetical protein
VVVSLVWVLEVETKVQGVVQMQVKELKQRKRIKRSQETSLKITTQIESLWFWACPMMRGFATLQKVLPLEGSREACNPHQAVYLTDVV